MHYKLLGFSHNGSVRRFLFQRITDPGIASEPFEVHADTVLARRFNVAVQELPALCARVLEAAGEQRPAGPVEVGESEMSTYAAELSAAAADAAQAAALRSQRCRAAAMEKRVVPRR